MVTAHRGVLFERFGQLREKDLRLDDFWRNLETILRRLSFVFHDLMKLAIDAGGRRPLFVLLSSCLRP